MLKDEVHIGELDNNSFTIQGSRFLTGRTTIMGMSSFVMKGEIQWK